MREMTTTLKMRLDLDKNADGAYITVWNVTYTYIGRNYLCGRFLERQLNATFYSDAGTSEMDSVEVDFGVINNFGTYNKKY